jgi:hypothetical protein
MPPGKNRMESTLPRRAVTACAGCLLLLAACSRQPVRHGAAAAGGRAATPVLTGIPACDAYLSTYLACHRAAGIFPPGQLQGRYEAMRDSLLHDARDPAIRPQLAHRCAWLADGLRDALHGKSCDVRPEAGGAP